MPSHFASGRGEHDGALALDLLADRYLPLAGSSTAFPFSVRSSILPSPGAVHSPLSSLNHAGSGSNWIRASSSARAFSWRRTAALTSTYTIVRSPSGAVSVMRSGHSISAGHRIEGVGGLLPDPPEHAATSRAATALGCHLKMRMRATHHAGAAQAAHAPRRGDTRATARASDRASINWAAARQPRAVAHPNRRRSSWARPGPARRAVVARPQRPGSRRPGYRLS